ncbi:hypothetical protein PIROE2DRAFT_21426 [Piromyces sp. E2]|nr:hypothetical protein PIROE2DRAFT_21426 [Piromyces sp. E2]|eukprot:OUM57918.1 hypothetical protein PIROE2DRAFT_21426 [Piromyces sp. E2]
MSILFLGIILSLINYTYCISLNFMQSPDKIVPGDLMNIKFNLTDFSKRKEYTINFSLCQSTDCNVIDQMKTKLEVDSKVLYAVVNNDTCFFSNKPVDNWYIKADILYDKEILYSTNTTNTNRELICHNPNCVEEGCPNFVANNSTISSAETTNNRELVPSNKESMENSKIDNNKIEDNDNNINKNNNPQKKTFILLLSISLVIVAVAFISVLYIKKFKKKDDDPIPIFSVEESSYCYDGNTHSPPLGSASYNSAILEKSILSSNRSINGQLKYCHSPKAADQSRLSVQLQPINSVNDCYSHSSQNSNRSKAHSVKSSQEKQNETNENNLKVLNPESPNFTSLSPVSMTSTIPFIPNSKPSKKKSVRSETSKKYSMPPSPRVYAETPIVIEKKVSNSYLFTDTSMLSEGKSRISNKRSFQSSHVESDVEAKVLSSKHYVLSNFEGDDSKEELNLHYGDIVSIINVLPDGWAYGELLLKYNHYENNGNPRLKSKGHKYRKFGYYPISCLSPDEEDDENNSNNDKKEKSIESNKATASKDKNNNSNDNIDQDEKAPLPKRLDASEVNSNNILFVHPRATGNALENSNNNALFVHPRSTGNTFNTKSSKSSKRSSLLNMFKKSSRDFGKDPLVFYNEPNGYNEKTNSREVNFSDVESNAGTEYLDAEEGSEQKRNSLDPKRISVRSSFSYRSYL